ncbi:membrane protein [Oceanobacillus picturae]|uniref:Membrane protein n=1 Tax=Oceanobacillus picturae TaxID=171693 RepID=A0A0U9H1S6_9BACI|nr:DUF3021 domain-containing protein [Oceanobacillus picturae]GAQ16538.1 membrane protein [Oceanobacillus picturae]
MILEITKRSMIGIAFGGIFTFIALTIMKLNNLESTVSEIWMHMGASMLLGIYYGLSSYIFSDGEGSYLKQTIIHFCLSLTVYFIIAFTVGWVPLNWLAALLSFIIFVTIYSFVWFGYYSYYKKVESSMNEHLNKK